MSCKISKLLAFIRTQEGRDKSKVVLSSSSFSKMASTSLNLFEPLLTELVILIVERVASYSLQDLVSVKLCSKFLNEVGNERSVYQKVILARFPPEPTWTKNKHTISFMKICIASENLEALYRKGVVILLFLVLFHLESIYFVILMCFFFYDLIFSIVMIQLH